MTHLVQFSSGMKIRELFKFAWIFFTFPISTQHHFPRIGNGVAKTAGNFTDSEMYLLTEIMDIFSSLTSNETYLLLFSYHLKFFLKNLPFKGGACHKFQAIWYIYIYIYICGPGSSVGIATELRAGRSGIESRWGRDFPLVQTGPGAHSASCKMGTGSFPGVKCGREVSCWPLTPF